MFNRLKLYTVQVQPGDSAALERPVFIPEGFNIFAFIFGALWAFYHRLWGIGIAILLIEALLMSLRTSGALLSFESVAVLAISYKVIVGYLANDWRRDALKRKGYALYDVVASDSELRASQRYFDRVLAARQAA